MFVLPIGLGTRWRRLPLITLGIGLVWILVFIFDRSGDHVFQKIFTSVADTGLRDRARKLFVDYCRARNGSRSRCEHYAVLVWTGYPGKGHRVMEKGEILNLSVEDEFARAESVRRELASCGDDKRCFVYKDIVWRFMDLGRAPPPGLTSLASYGGYAFALSGYRAKLRDICWENGCLVQSNINFRSLIGSEVRHGGFFHLFNNLFVLLIFGAYAELRSSRFFYAAAVFLGGSLGMAVHAAYFSSGDTIALGGSANVAAAMGLFFVFFFRRNMRFIVWLPRKIYTGTSFPAPVAYAFPLVFILTDVIGGFQSGFSELKTVNVAHFAHLTGFAAGAFMGLAYLKFRPLPSPFLYAGEREDLVRLNECRDLAVVLTKADAMARVNPDNVAALEIGADAFLRWASAAAPNENAALFDRGREFLDRHLATICALGRQADRLVPAARLLSRMPMYFSYPHYLARLGPESTLKLADFAVVKGHPILAFRLYDLYLQRHQGADGAAQVLATTLAALALMPGTRENDEALRQFTAHRPDSALLGGIAAWRLERRPA